MPLQRQQVSGLPCSRQPGGVLHCNPLSFCSFSQQHPTPKTLLLGESWVSLHCYVTGCSPYSCMVFSEQLVLLVMTLLLLPLLPGCLSVLIIHFLAP